MVMCLWFSFIETARSLFPAHVLAILGGGPHTWAPSRKRCCDRRFQANWHHRRGSGDGAVGRLSDVVGLLFLPEKFRDRLHTLRPCRW